VVNAGQVSESSYRDPLNVAVAVIGEPDTPILNPCAIRFVEAGAHESVRDLISRARLQAAQQHGSG